MENSTTNIQYHRYSESYWQIFRDICKIFANKIAEISNQYTHIFILDHRLLLTSCYICEMYTRQLLNSRVLILFKEQFPQQQYLLQFPNYHEIISSILTAEVLNFGESEYAKHFLQMLKSLYQISYQTREGTIYFEY